MIDSMRQTHIRNVDLGLLATLQALVEERSITRAAERMFLSQPAMSRAFDRLQELFGDELLVRARGGYEPTHRALHLHAELDRLLPRLEALVRGEDFDPATATDVFRIASTDNIASVLLPAVMAMAAERAPHVGIEIFPWDEGVVQRLETNALDLALWINAAPKAFRTQPLFKDRFICLAREGHPAGDAPLTLERYLSFAHAAVTLADQRQGLVDGMLEARGLERDVRLKIPYFAPAAWIVERSDLILTVPERLGRRLAQTSRTVMLEPPAELAAFEYIQIWRPRLDADPAHQWLRQLFAQAAAGG